MLDVYPVYLKLGWKHSVSCVSRTPRTRNTHHRRESTCCPYTISRRIADSLKCPARSSASRSVAESSESSSLSWRSTSALHPGLGLAAGGIAACPPRHCARRREIILVLLPQYTLYLCIWLCIWCVSASKTETHRYTRIRTPQPVYLTSRPCMRARSRLPSSRERGPAD